MKRTLRAVIEQRFPHHVRVYGQCVMCGITWALILDKEAFKAWEAGQVVQEAFPKLKPHERELLLSSTCNPCWESLFPEED